ncbi:MAG: hypothetical protein IPJ85_18040 [Flavobacteriales bacterium]|nr:hypothetical protein [Flavobacteriales bacterium]
MTPALSSKGVISQVVGYSAHVGNGIVGHADEDGKIGVAVADISFRFSIYRADSHSDGASWRCLTDHGDLCAMRSRSDRWPSSIASNATTSCSLMSSRT